MKYVTATFISYRAAYVLAQVHNSEIWNGLSDAQFKGVFISMDCYESQSGMTYKAVLHYPARTPAA